MPIGPIPNFWNKFLLAYSIILVSCIMVWFIEIYISVFFFVWLNSGSFSVTPCFGCRLLIILRLVPHPKPPYIVLEGRIH
jgi:accessory gene regulator protein AgrB